MADDAATMVLGNPPVDHLGRRGNASRLMDLLRKNDRKRGLLRKLLTSAPCVAYEITWRNRNYDQFLRRGIIRIWYDGETRMVELSDKGKEWAAENGIAAPGGEKDTDEC